jgi:hypothetical protein
MSPEQQDHLIATRDALRRAREADERLRAALAECTVWLTLAMTEDEEEHDGS